MLARVVGSSVMPRRLSLGLLLLVALACTSRPASFDDEAGDASEAGSSGAEASVSESTSAPLDLPPPDECDVFAQDCPVGEKCTYDMSHQPPATVCASVTGDKPPGDDCLSDGMGHDDCDASSMCYEQDVLGFIVGTCVSFCTGSPAAPDCPALNHEGDWLPHECSLHWTDGWSAGLAVCASDCDMVAHDCPNEEKCVPIFEYDDSHCVPVLGQVPPGGGCTVRSEQGLDDCDASSTCVGANEDGTGGTCVAMCWGTYDVLECPENSSCVWAGNSTLCIPACDPIAQDCGPGLGCFWGNTMFGCNDTAGNIPTGQPCGYINDCVPGDFCVDAATLPSCAGSACCTQFCNLPEGDAGCVEQPGTACMPFYEPGMAPEGFEHVGVCILP